MLTKTGTALLIAAIAAAAAIALAPLAMAHYVPDPCHPQSQHEETCTHDGDDDHSHQGDR